MTSTRHTTLVAFATVLLIGCGQNKIPSKPETNAATNETSALAAGQDSSTATLIENCRESRHGTLSLKTASSSDLQRVGELKHLNVLEIYESDFDAADLERLSDLVELKRLRLEDFAATDATVNVISKFSKLEILNLPASCISDQSFEKLVSSLPNLMLLRIGGMQLSDKGVASLSTLTSLRFLHLCNAPLTDAGLKTFRTMHELESLYLDGDNATDDGIRDLLKANPKLHFHRNQTHVADDPNADGH